MNLCGVTRYVPVKGMLFNARSLMGKMDEFRLNFIDGSTFYSFIFVTETWFDDSCPSSAFIGADRYSIYRTDRHHGRGGGVAAFIHKGFPSYLVLSHSEEGIDLLIIDVKLSDEFSRFILVYRAPSCPMHSHIQMVNILETNLNLKTCLLGDFNLPKIDFSIPTFNAPANSMEEKFFEFFHQYNLKQLVVQPTRENNILDLIFIVDESDFISSVDVESPFSNSDHNRISFSVNVNRGTTSQSSFLQFKNADYEKINDFLFFTDWETLFEYTLDIDKLWSIFKGVLISAINLFVPSKNENCRSKNKIPLSSESKNFRKLKKKLWTKFKRTGDINYKNQWSVFSKLFRQSLREDVTKFERSILNTRSSSAFWKFVNSKVRNVESVSVLDIDGEKIINDLTKARAFSDYFRSVMTSDVPIIDDFDQVRLNHLLKEADFSPNNILLELSKLSNKLSYGPDKIPPFFLKKVRLSISSVLSVLYNVSFWTCKVPFDWRSANVVPVFKKGSKLSVSNYRPISLTCSSCQPLERIIQSAISDTIRRNNIITAAQHGGLKGCSTTTQLLECFNDWTTFYDHKKPTVVVYLDLAKAFDTISHSRLLHKLGSCGITNPLLEWLKNYLTQRYQRVKVGDSFSDWIHNSSGIPQGSVLGPLFFIIYINDITSVIRNCQIKIFVDDTKIYIPVSHENDIALLQNDLDRLNVWALSNQLKFSVQKCFYIVFGISPFEFNLSLNQSDLISEHEAKDLGVWVCSDLKFSSHIDKTVAKAYRSCRLLLNNFKTENIALLCKLYMTFVVPILEYASPVWSPHHITQIDKLERVQKFFTRKLRNMQHISYKDRLAHLNIESLEYRRLKIDLKLAYDILNLKTRLTIDDFFSFSTYHATRGHDFKLQVPHSRTNIRKYFFSCRVIPIYNSLPQPVVHSSSSASFSKKIGLVDLSSFLKCSYLQ